MTIAMTKEEKQSATHKVYDILEDACGNSAFTVALQQGKIWLTNPVRTIVIEVVAVNRSDK